METDGPLEVIESGNATCIPIKATMPPGLMCGGGMVRVRASFEYEMKKRNCVVEKYKDMNIPQTVIPFMGESLTDEYMVQ